MGGHDVKLADTSNRRNQSRSRVAAQAPPKETPDKVIAEVAKLIFKYLRSASYHEPSLKRVLNLLFHLPFVFELDTLALTAAVIGHPDLRTAVPELQNFDVFGPYAETVRRADRRHLTSKDQIMNWKDPSDHAVYAIQEILRKPLDFRKDE